MKHINYVKLYANRLREDNSLFSQQKMLLDSQIKGSSSLFRNMFLPNFKENARKYLKKRGLC
jgi:hypothetical protein